MAKSKNKSTFENDSKSVLETVLTPEAKARLQREMSLTQGGQSAAAREVLAFPGEKQKKSSTSAKTDKKGAEKKASSQAMTKKKAPGGRLTLVGLEKQVARDMQEMRTGLGNLENSVQAALSRSEDSQRQLQSLADKTDQLGLQFDQAANALRAKPWEEVQDSLQKTLQGFDERLQRLETAASGPAETKAAPAQAATSADAQAPSQDSCRVSAAMWLDKARAFWSGKRYSNPQAAVECLDKALALDPRNAECLNERGLAKADAGYLREALADFSRAIETSPSMTAAYHNRGLLYMKMNAAEKACRDFQRAASLGDDRAWRKARASGYCDGSFLKKLLKGIID